MPLRIHWKLWVLSPKVSPEGHNFAYHFRSPAMHPRAIAQLQPQNPAWKRELCCHATWFSNMVQPHGHTQSGQLSMGGQSMHRWVKNDDGAVSSIGTRAQNYALSACMFRVPDCSSKWAPALKILSTRGKNHQHPGLSQPVPTPHTHSVNWIPATGRHRKHSIYCNLHPCNLPCSLFISKGKILH